MRIVGTTIAMIGLTLATSDVSAQYGGMVRSAGYDGVHPVYPNPLAGQSYFNPSASFTNYGNSMSFSNGIFINNGGMRYSGFVPVYNNVNPGLMYNSQNYYYNPYGSGSMYNNALRSQFRR